MTAPLAFTFPVGLEAYLGAEASSSVQHEYIDGLVRLIPDEPAAHDGIAERVHARLESADSQAGMITVLTRPMLLVRPSKLHAIYRPDLMLTSDPGDNKDSPCRHPRLLIEVSSAHTRNIDRVEKPMAYIQIESLEEYAVIMDDRFQAFLYRRDNDWQRENLTGLDAVLELRSIGLSMMLAEVYAGIME